MNNEKIKIVVTDSGLGGLSVFAEVYKRLQKQTLLKPTELIFANALPEKGRGYNKMPNMSQKIETFNKVLYGINEKYRPAIISIACNTLSVFVEKTEFFTQHPKKILEIVGTGIQSIDVEIKNDQNAKIVIFGTETTIESAAHSKMLMQGGYRKENIIAQSCPNLASEIELDSQSEKTKKIVSDSVDQAVGKLKNKNDKMYIFLACTHYGYVADYFLESFYCRKFGDCSVINPNDSMVNKIMDYIKNKQTSTIKSLNNNPEIKIVSRCEILPEEIKSISKLISPISKDTVTVLENYELDTGLFVID